MEFTNKPAGRTFRQAEPYRRFCWCHMFGTLGAFLSAFQVSQWHAWCLIGELIGSQCWWW